MRTDVIQGPSASSRHDVLRGDAANQANRADAEVWRWFCCAYEERRIRWCYSAGLWYVSVDNRHLSTEADFDAAIRVARDKTLHQTSHCKKR